MEPVQKIKCINRAWFVLSFEVADGNGHSLRSDALPIQREGILDLTEGGFQEGAEVELQVRAVMGKTLAVMEKLRFASSGKTAVFEVRGTSLDFRVELVAIREAEE